MHKKIYMCVCDEYYIYIHIHKRIQKIFEMNNEFRQQLRTQ